MQENRLAHFFFFLFFFVYFSIPFVVSLLPPPLPLLLSAVGAVNGSYKERKKNNMVRCLAGRHQVVVLSVCVCVLRVLKYSEKKKVSSSLINCRQITQQKKFKKSVEHSSWNVPGHSIDQWQQWRNNK